MSSVNDDIFVIVNIFAPKDTSLAADWATLVK